MISQPRDTGNLTTKRYWWSQNQNILMTSQPKDTGDLTTKDIGNLTTKDTGDPTTKRYFWSHNQKILVISQPKNIFDLTTKRYLRSHNQEILLISQTNDTGTLTTKSEPHCSESVSAVTLRATVSPLIPLCGRHSSTVKYRLGKQAPCLLSSPSEMEQPTSKLAHGNQTTINQSHLTSSDITCGQQSEVWTANHFRTF